MPDFLSELKRRNVFRVAIAYVVIGWLLLQVLEVLVDAFDAPAWVLKIVIALLAVGFLPSLALSWAFELTPQGLKREGQIDRSQSITNETARKLDLITIAAVVIGAVFVGWTQLRSPTSPSTNMPAASEQGQAMGLPDIASVAVLPFVNMSANADNQYFADGLTETLLHMLAQVRELKVAARTSSFAFKGQDKDIREIATALNVAHVLEGSVQRVGERVRITAQLIRASDGFHVWSENYDHTLDDVFSIQDEIATDVRSALSTSLLGAASVEPIQGVATKNIEAYDLYLQALTERTKGSYGSLQEAERLLKNALVRDATFLEARTELALLLWAQANTGLIPREEATAQGGALLAQVLERRPQDVRARSLQTYLDAYELFFGGNMPAGFAQLEKLALLAEQAPSEPLPREFLADVYRRTDQPSKSREQLEILLQLDPLNPNHHEMLGKLYYEEDALDQARASMRRSLELEPEQPNVYGSLARIEQRAGDIVGYVRNFEKAIDLDPEDHELPAIIAEECYRYGLIDIGDRYKAMTDALAPTSPVARKLELLRALAINDMASVETLARQILLDKVEDRQGAWFSAAIELFHTSVLKEDFSGAAKFLDELFPGYTDGSKYDLPSFAVFSRILALGSLKVSLSPEAFARFLEGHKHFLINVARSDPDKNPFLKVNLLAAEGQREQAIEVLLNELLSQPEARYHYVREALWQPHLAPLKDDTRVAQALARYELEAQASSKKLIKYFASRK